MRLSIASKIVTMIVATLITACMAVMVMTIFLMQKNADRQLDATVARLRGVVEEYYRINEDMFMDSTRFAAGNADLVEAVAARDTPRLQVLGKELMEQNRADLCTITDEHGIVLARGHSTQVGDSLAQQYMVKTGILGEATGGMVESAVIPFSIRASVPVIREGKVAGTIALGVSVVTEGFVDRLKQLSGLDVTFFKGDTRVMTTIIQDNKRVIGTKLDNPEIAEAVLKRGETLFRDLSLFGIPYKTAYWPVVNVEKKIVGIWFVGQPYAEYLAERNRVILLALAASALVALVLAGFGVVFGRKLAKPVKDVTAFASAVAGGNLDAPLHITAKDEVGVLALAMETMVANLKNRIREAEEVGVEAERQAQRAREAVNEAEHAGDEARAKGERLVLTAGELERVAEVIASASDQLYRQVEEAANGARAQANRSSESATAMEEMSASVREVAGSAGNASEISESTKEKAVEGARVVAEAVNSIHRVQESSLALKSDMSVLAEQAQGIKQIMSVISDIADQTNLLALNAAIEAARAGDAGRGFAVVADEVRKLAEKTMASTSDVSHAVLSIHDSVSKSISQVDVTVESIQQTTAMAAQSGEALEHIVSMANSAVAQVQSIASASEEQSAVSEQISRAVAEVSQISARTVGTMHEASSAVGQLAEQAHVLMELVRDMKQG